MAMAMAMAGRKGVASTLRLVMLLSLLALLSAATASVQQTTRLRLALALDETPTTTSSEANPTNASDSSSNSSSFAVLGEPFASETVSRNDSNSKPLTVQPTSVEANGNSTEPVTTGVPTTDDAVEPTAAPTNSTNTPTNSTKAPTTSAPTDVPTTAAPTTTTAPTTTPIPTTSVPTPTPTTTEAPTTMPVITIPPEVIHPSTQPPVDGTKLYAKRIEAESGSVPSLMRTTVDALHDLDNYNGVDDDPSSYIQFKAFSGYLELEAPQELAGKNIFYTFTVNQKVSWVGGQLLWKMYSWQRRQWMTIQQQTFSGAEAGNWIGYVWTVQGKDFISQNNKILVGLVAPTQVGPSDIFSLDYFQVDAKVNVLAT